MRVGRHEHARTPGPSSPACSAAPAPAFLEHEKAKAELKGLMPEDAKEAIGHGVRAKRSKSGAISFESAGWRPAMHRSSETIGAIAAALAKAQAELINPEKSLVGDDPLAMARARASGAFAMRPSRAGLRSCARPRPA